MINNPGNPTRRKVLQRWKNLGQLAVEIVIAGVISAVLHPEINLFVTGKSREAIPWTAWVEYFLTLIFVVVAEHAVLRIAKEWSSSNWKAIQELMEGEHRIPEGVIPRLAKTLTHQDADRTRKLLNAIERSHALPEEAKEALHSFLIDLAVHEYAEDVFARRIRKTQQEMAALKNEDSFLSDIDTQYELAAGLASRFATLGVETIYATALDPPGKFITSFGRDYFGTQSHLPSIGLDAFINNARSEMAVLSELTALARSEIKKKVHPNVNYTTPVKARIVVTSTDDLLSEFSGRQSIDHFKYFNKWHFETDFGLRYLVLDKLDKANGKDLYKNYLKRVRVTTHAGNASQAIGDFVVYNSNVVFGRIDRDEENMQIRMLHTPKKVEPYKALFLSLWNDAMSLGELWVWLEESGKMTEEGDKAFREVAQAMIDSFRERYKSSAEQPVPGALPA